MSTRIGIVCAALILAFLLVPVLPADGAGEPETTITSGPTGLTKEKRPTFAFTASQPGTFMCKLDHTVGPFPCTSPFQWPPKRGTDGDHFFEVYAVANGVKDPTPATASFRIDTSPPPLRIDKHPGDVVRTKKPSATVEVAFSSTDSGASFRCARDDGTAQPCQSPYSASFPLGRHLLAVSAVDAAGNVSHVQSVLFTVVSIPKPGAPPTCSQFVSQAAAQRFFDAHGSRSLDSDRDGVACDRNGSPYEVVITIDYNARHGFFFGFTHAADPHLSFDFSPVDCWKARFIDVYEVKAGSDPRVASARIGPKGGSNTTGIWKATARGKSGRFYAKIRSVPGDSRRGCLGGTSPTQRF